MRTRITSLFGIEKPIICAGMSDVATPELAAAVSNAGGLGIINLTTLPPSQAKQAIDKVRALTERPFGVNMTQLLPSAKENINIAIDAKVPVINTAFGKCDWYRDKVHAYGGKVLVTTSTLKHALAAQDQGADAIIATSYEAAAHAGEIGAMALIPAIRDRVSIPIIAAGGIADGRGLIAAFALGADAVSMGTRFMVSKESGAHANAIQATLDTDVMGTLRSKNYDGVPVRAISTPFSRKMAQRKPSLLTMLYRAQQYASATQSDIKPLLREFPQNIKTLLALSWLGHGLFYLVRGISGGDLETGIHTAGQSLGIIRNIESAADIVDNIMNEAANVQQSFSFSVDP
ncbi:MAG: enoyl-ACP reductase [Cellvibrionaceae bacterium]|nr:enoyl-ACP reductase [Cellvibrionaceae bacterium]|tara:strand:- start:15572 stop:16609 length:1038 start_codon:yes stop_codon:yes gene_type:complete